MLRYMKQLHYIHYRLFLPYESDCFLWIGHLSYSVNAHIYFPNSRKCFSLFCLRLIWSLVWMEHHLMSAGNTDWPWWFNLVCKEEPLLATYEWRRQGFGWCLYLQKYENGSIKFLLWASSSSHAGEGELRQGECALALCFAYSVIFLAIHWFCLFRSMPEHAEHLYRHWNWTWEATIWIEIGPQKRAKWWRSRLKELGNPLLFSLVPCFPVSARL